MTVRIRAASKIFTDFTRLPRSGELTVDLSTRYKKLKAMDNLDEAIVLDREPKKEENQSVIEGGLEL
jgi:hypothetical protein